MKNSCILFTEEEYKIVQTNMKKNGDSIQDHMTKTALKILNKQDFKSGISSKHAPSIQFRLDPTIHKLLKEKAKSLNRDMSDLFKELLLKE